jgi:hypothetical protein
MASTRVTSLGVFLEGTNALDKNLVQELGNHLFVSKKELEQIIEGTGWEICKYINSQNAAYIAVL